VLAGAAAGIALSIGTDMVMHGTGVFPPYGQPMSEGLFVLATAYRTVATWDKGPEFGPKWYPLLLIALALPQSWLGARLRERQLAPLP
jgi:hypothetical protein